MMPGIELSVIVPCFNEQEVLPQTHARILTVLQSMSISWELIYVDDGSADSTWRLLEVFCRDNLQVKLIRLQKNAGHQAALWAGMERCAGAFVVVLDADLQDPPELIPQLLAALQNSQYDVAYGRRIRRRGESWFKKISAFIFYRILAVLSTYPIAVDAGDFRLMRRCVVDAVLQTKRQTMYLRGVTSSLGFKHAPVDYVRDPRVAGRSKYSLRRMLQLALAGVAESASLWRLGAIALLVSGAFFWVWSVDIGVPGQFVFFACFLLSAISWVALGLVCLWRLRSRCSPPISYTVHSTTNIPASVNRQ